MENHAKIVAITHLVTPSLFYCRDLSLMMEEAAIVEEVETKLKKLAETRNESEFVPKQGDIVGYFLHCAEKWIRCEVDYSSMMSGEQIVKLWAIDYGQPLYTANLRDIFYIDESIVFPPSKIFKAGLGVLPARLRFDSCNCKIKIEFNEAWTERSVSEFKSWLEDVEKQECLLQFTPSPKYAEAGHQIGDLIVLENNNVSYGMSTKLLQAEFAVSIAENEFKDHFNRLDPIERSDKILRQPEGVLKLASLEFSNLEKMETETEIIPSDYLKSIKQKVTDWLNIQDSSASSIVTNNSLQMNKPKQIPARMAFLAKSRAKLQSGPVFPPPGNRMYAQSRVSSIHEGDYVSASQVGCESVISPTNK